MFSSLVFILNNFFHSVFCPLNCFGWSKKFKIYRNLDSVASIMIHTFSNYSTFYCILGSVRKRLKVLIKFFGICLPVFPSIITATTFLSYSFPSPGSKYKFSSPRFGVYSSIYAWYPQVKELNEN